MRSFSRAIMQSQYSERTSESSVAIACFFANRSISFEILLSGIMLYMILKAAQRRAQLHPIILATLLSWMFFVRPTGVIPVAAVTIFGHATSHPFIRGGLGQFEAIYLMPLALAHAGRLGKFGA